MQSYTTTFTFGQWVPQTLGDTGLSQTAEPVSQNLVLFKFVLQEAPLFMPSPEPTMVNEQMLAQMYAEFADEDRALANMGISDYARLLADEDKGA